MTDRHDTAIGIVVIGRNEGERLVACLQSLGKLVARTVYVDSGSSDGSPERAEQLGARMVTLDLSAPFTAARARNVGFAALIEAFAEIEYVQFVDGDCTLDVGWLDKAAAFMAERPEIAVVCGRRRERFPKRSVYNQLCDWEWDSPIGEASECGGDSFIRVAAFEAVGGYADALIAGEEPDMCVRLRENGWRIWRLDAEMSLHDANIVRFAQWWRRSTRAGHAFAEVSARHRQSRFGIWRGSVRRSLVWGLALPVLIALGGALIHPAVLLGLLVYPLQMARLAMRPHSHGWRYGMFTVLGKFPEAVGILQLYGNRLTHRRNGLIEYK